MKYSLKVVGKEAAKVITVLSEQIRNKINLEIGKNMHRIHY